MFIQHSPLLDWLYSNCDLLVIAVACPVMVALLMGLPKRKLGARLNMLAADKTEAQQIKAGQKPEAEWPANSDTLAHLSDRLGKAGFFRTESRRKAKILGCLLVTSCTLTVGLGLGLLGETQSAVALGSFIGLYLGVTAWVLYLRYLRDKLAQQVLFRLPLALEALVLLVESGLGILPALHAYLSTQEKNQRENPIAFVLSLVYGLCIHGIPFANALTLVANHFEHRTLRHVFLHLDLSATEGGELGAALRSLAEFAHTEWKLSVDTRVRRLENLVVFPVFVAVFGLMFIAVAVPAVPIADFVAKMSPDSGSARREVSSPSITND